MVTFNAYEWYENDMQLHIQIWIKQRNTPVFKITNIYRFYD